MAPITSDKRNHGRARVDQLAGESLVARCLEAMQQAITREAETTAVGYQA